MTLGVLCSLSEIQIHLHSELLLFTSSAVTSASSPRETQRTYRVDSLYFGKVKVIIEQLSFGCRKGMCLHLLCGFTTSNIIAALNTQESGALTTIKVHSSNPPVVDTDLSDSFPLSKNRVNS